MGSHDFIKFPPKLGEFSPKTWLLLGEVQAKIEHIKRLPIPPDDSNRLRRMYLAKGVHSTTAIEGNSFSEEEVGKIINREMKARPSREYQQRQIDNMVKAFNQVRDDEIAGAAPAFSVELLNSYHRLVLDNLADSLAEDVVIGGLRTHRVEVGRYLAPPPKDCARLMNNYCDWLNQDMSALAGYELAAQIVKALAAHVHFAWIHPYGDGNGRMARLIEFIILLKAGAPDIAAHLPSNFYNKTRDQYYRHLQDSHGEFRDGSYPAEGNLQGFIEYALQGLKDELDDQFSIIHGMQIRTIWHDSIHAEFRKRFSENLTKSRQRQKRLILDLTDRLERPIKKGEIRDLTQAYSQKTDRTIQRDLNELVKMKLLKRDETGYLPNINILMGFKSGAQL